MARGRLEHDPCTHMAASRPLGTPLLDGDTSKKGIERPNGAVSAIWGVLRLVYL